MAVFETNSLPLGSAWNRVVAKVSTFVEEQRAERTKQRQIRATINELSALSNRDLADLGMSRSEIGRVARQAVEY